MKGAKFRMGQTVRCVNERQPKIVIGVCQNGGFHYSVEHYGGNVTHRIAEASLVDFKSGK